MFMSLLSCLLNLISNSLQIILRLLNLKKKWSEAVLHIKEREHALYPQTGSCCLTAQRRDKQGGFYWGNLLSGMALCTDIRISISISKLPNIPKWAWQRTKPASSPGAKVTGGWWCTCHYGANDPLPGPLKENKQKSRQDMETIWTVLDVCPLLCLMVTALVWEAMWSYWWNKTCRR